jgi:hypothetical protein
MARQEILQGAAFCGGVTAGASHLRQPELGFRGQLTTLGFRLSIQALGSCDVPELLELHLGSGNTCRARLDAARVEFDYLRV